MVQILPRYDPGGQFGQALGSGISEVLGVQADRNRSLKALESLNDIDEKALKKMSFPQQMQTFMKPFVGLKDGNMMISEIMPKWMEYLQNLADLPEGEVEDSSDDAPGYLTDEQKNLWHANKKMEKLSGDPDQDPMSVRDVTKGPEKERLGVDPEPITQVGPNRKGLPNDMPGELRHLASVFPEIRAQSLRGNAQGLSFDDKLKYTNYLTKQRVPRDVAIRRTEDLSNYLKEQGQAFQEIQNLVTKEAQTIYGDSPNYSLFERQMQTEADRQVDLGRMEPNSVVNAARQRGKQLETLFNNLRSAKGRPMFEIGVGDRKKSSGNWISPLVKAGEIQTSTELLMQSQIPQKDGSMVPGPDWGPIRAIEIVQSQIPGSKVIQRTTKFVKGLPDARIESYQKDPFGGYEARKKQANKGLQMMEDYIADDLQPQDSLVLLRGYAKERGYSEEEFRNVLEKAKERRGGEFSEYQNWEESTLLPYDVKPSLYEIWRGFRSLSDWFTGKK